MTKEPAKVKIKIINKIMPGKMSKRRLNKKTFVLSAIHRLRKDGYMGIHAVYSGFNQAFREYYNEDPISEVDKLVKEGIVIKHPVKGGVMLYDYKEYHNSDIAKKRGVRININLALKKILGD